jgi:hypothetical protein
VCLRTLVFEEVLEQPEARILTLLLLNSAERQRSRRELQLKVPATWKLIGPLLLFAFLQFVQKRNRRKTSRRF